MPIAHQGGLFRRRTRGIRVINRPAGALRSGAGRSPGGVHSPEAGQRAWRHSGNDRRNVTVRVRIGSIPALLAAGVDHALAGHNVSYRIALTALFGYVISYLPLAAACGVGLALGPDALLLGLIGAVPSAVCSWLAAEAETADPLRHHDRMRSSGRM